MSDNVIVIGAGGHAKVIADIIIRHGDTLLGFLDDNVVGTVMNYPVLGKMSDIYNYTDNIKFIIGIGSNDVRYKIADTYALNWYTAIHPTAIIAADVTIGEGTSIMANAVINVSSIIGKHSIVNTAAVVEHDNILGDFVHISPNVTLNGTVSVGDGTHIGAAAVVINNINICNHVIVGAGGVVVDNITEAGTYVGIPTRRLE